MIISSHIFSTLRDTCDEIHLLKKGSLVRKVNQSEFDELEQEMKDFTIGNSLEKLGL